MKTRTTAYDSADYLNDDNAINAYMAEALKTKDTGFIAHALGVVARARGMSNVAKASGLSRESLYKALSPNGNPEFATIMRVMEALKLELSITTRPTI